MAKKSGKSDAQKSVAKPKTAVAPLPPKLPSAWRIARMSVTTLWQHKRLFGALTLTYGLLNLVLVQGIAGHTDVSELKTTLDELFTGNYSSLASGLSIFALLIGSAGNTSSETAGAYQLFLSLISSLAIIWALRQVLAGKVIRVRDAFYRGMYPLIPFILVLLVIGLQLLPLLIGSTLYSLVVTNGIAVDAIEKVFWAIVYILLAGISLYLLSSSLFALYIATLPDMTPLKALRSARELVRGRRGAVVRKLVGLPIILLLVAALIMLPIIIWLTPLAEWVFFILTMLGLLAVHTYMYTFYRELLNE